MLYQVYSYCKYRTIKIYIFLQQSSLLSEKIISYSVKFLILLYQYCLQIQLGIQNVVLYFAPQLLPFQTQRHPFFLPPFPVFMSCLLLVTFNTLNGFCDLSLCHDLFLHFSQKIEDHKGFCDIFAGNITQPCDMTRTKIAKCS